MKGFKHKLKQWYSIEEASNRLTITLGEEILPKDIMDFVLNEHLPIFWYTRHVTAQRGEHGDKFITLPKLTDEDKEESCFITTFIPDEGELVSLLDGPKQVHWQMVGALEDYLLSYSFEKPSELASLEGFFVSDENGLYRVVDSFKTDSFDEDKKKNYGVYDIHRYYPSTDFPDFSELGFRRIDLEQFEQNMLGQGTNNDNQELTNQERRSLYKMIYAMAMSKYSWEKDPHSIVSKIHGDIERHGLSLDKGTLKKWLDGVADFISND